MNMEEKEQKEHIDIQKETLKPITKATLELGHGTPRSRSTSAMEKR
jgi:hypothetical protein